MFRVTLTEEGEGEMAVRHGSVDIAEDSGSLAATLPQEWVSDPLKSAVQNSPRTYASEATENRWPRDDRAGKTTPECIAGRDDGGPPMRSK